ncbi:MAG TPA: NADH-quinone oxidoreductase subunit J [Verrucomicrobiota bacterium]|nr:NADH-quinone oxidoreductase subunit J [Verrucomicrobiota bacterium]HNU51538.1 NADH-quinone oxidoreductase subunit J [Verrucomicrobiota bacterium]
METAFLIVSAITLAGAVAAVSLRNLVHCVLAAAVAFAGLAGVFLTLEAEFVAFAQLLVYVGAVSILMVMALGLTRHVTAPAGARAWAPWTVGVGVALLVLAAVVSAVPAAGGPQPAGSGWVAAVRVMGETLMTRHVVALEVLGLLLTAALIGAGVIALPRRKDEE